MTEQETRERRTLDVPGQAQRSSDDSASAARARRAKRTACPDLFEREVARRLRACGADESLVERVRTAFEAARDDGDDRHAIDRAADVIGSLFDVAHSPRLRGAMRVLAFVGPTGCGKTTSLVKLATRLVRAGRRVALATLDTHRVGAVEALRAHAKLLGVACHVLNEPGAVAQLVHAGLDAVLVDTCGRPSFDLEALTKLRAGLDGSLGRFDAYLVLPASASRASLDEACTAFLPLGLAGTVLTKLDETRQPAPLCEHVLERGLAVALLADGPELGDLRRAAGEHFADLLLRGRLA